MKKALLLPALVLAVTIFIPTQQADARSRSNFKARVCNAIERSEIRAWKRFDQDKSWTVRRVQNRINLQDRFNCAPTGTIAETLSERTQFSSLVGALDQAELVDVFAGEGDFTLFAPTNQAFAALGEDTLNAVLGDNDLLTNILTYHVVDPAAVPSAVPSDVAVTLTSASMFNGESVDVEVRSGKLFINDSQVIVTDLKTTNGIVHVIDTVLVP